METERATSSRDPIRLFVGTDRRMGKAETALVNSLLLHTSVDVDLTWMRSGEERFTWNMGREPGLPYHRGNTWATDFTCFRWAVPELAGHRGRAVYLDVDMLVLGDLRELEEVDLSVDGVRWPGMVPASRRQDVIVFDCSHPFWKNWPTIEEMVPSGCTMKDYRRLLGDALAPLIDPAWDNLDGQGLCSDTKLLHFTDMRTQPWKPWPEAFNYPDRHPCPEAEALFWSLHDGPVAAPSCRVREVPPRTP